MANELYNENYHGRDRIRKREQVIMEKWRHLMELLDKKKRVLTGYSDLLGMFREIEAITVEMKDMEVSTCVSKVNIFDITFQNLMSERERMS